jgi:hypothetical protein
MVNAESTHWSLLIWVQRYPFCFACMVEEELNVVLQHVHHLHHICYPIPANNAPRPVSTTVLFSRHSMFSTNVIKLLFADDSVMNTIIPWWALFSSKAQTILGL